MHLSHAKCRHNRNQDLGMEDRRPVMGRNQIEHEHINYITNIKLIRHTFCNLFSKLQNLKFH